jgi:hypothetical protein
MYNGDVATNPAEEKNGQRNDPGALGPGSRNRYVDGLREDWPGRSQLPAMVHGKSMTGRSWRQGGAASALFAVARE